MQARARVTDAFCQVCCTSHTAPEACPGELRPTGPERHGWSALLETAKGPQVCGVLLAPSSAIWRARIVTYPKAPWMIPGGRGAIRFSGVSPHEAESRAVAYVHALCAAKGWTWNDVIPLRRQGDLKAMPERRKRRSIPIRYATEDRPAQLSTVVNMSEGGLFLAAPDPLREGTLLRLEIEIYGSMATLEGTVVWTRTELEPGRPRGMGIDLLESPAVWVSFVRGLP